MGNGSWILKIRDADKRIRRDRPSKRGLFFRFVGRIRGAWKPLGPGTSWIFVV